MLSRRHRFMFFSALSVVIVLSASGSCHAYSSVDAGNGAARVFEYTFSEMNCIQTFVAPHGASYRIELWGASGADTHQGEDVVYPGGSGGYAGGDIALAAGEKLYVYVGRAGVNSDTGAKKVYWYSFGGEATDVRLVSGGRHDENSLLCRIAVAAAGGGGGRNHHGRPDPISGNAGGLTGYAAAGDGFGAYPGNGASQIGGGAAGASANVPAEDGGFGFGGDGGINWEYNVRGGTGGGGYYGGGGGGSHSVMGCYGAAGGGGSSYISGHRGCVAVTSASDSTPKPARSQDISVHYSGKVFTNTVMIDGAGYLWSDTKGPLTPMPKPGGGLYEPGRGHRGDGAVRITLNGTQDVLYAERIRNIHTINR